MGINEEFVLYEKGRLPILYVTAIDKVSKFVNIEKNICPNTQYD